MSGLSEEAKQRAKEKRAATNVANRRIREQEEAREKELKDSWNRVYWRESPSVEDICRTLNDLCSRVQSLESDRWGDA